MHRILVVAAHPDDEILGCGGTLIKRRQSGDEIGILILGEGVTARYQNKCGVERDKFEELYRESKNVANYIGAEKHSILGFPDNRFDSIDLLDIIKEVEVETIFLEVI